jgi:hypothetical protein
VLLLYRSQFLAGFHGVSSAVFSYFQFAFTIEKLDGPAVSELRRAIVEAKQRWSAIGWVTKNLLSRAPPCFGSRCSRLYLQSIAPTNPHWARVVGYGPFFLCVIHKKGLCPSIGDINGLMMMMMIDSTV